MPYDRNFMGGGGNFLSGLSKGRPPEPGFRRPAPGGMPPQPPGPPGGAFDKSIGDTFAGPPPAGPPPGAPAPPPVGGGEPSGIPGMGGDNAWQPGTPYEPGQSVAGDDREGHLAMMNYTAEQNALARKENRADWSPGDWDYAIDQAMTPKSRPSQTKRGAWEYLVKGNWVPQGIFDDPKWIQNVYEPWQKQIANKWRLMREKSEKWKKGHSGTPKKPKPRPRPAPMRSTTSGGGGGMDPAMIQALIGG